MRVFAAGQRAPHGLDSGYLERSIGSKKERRSYDFELRNPGCSQPHREERDLFEPVLTLRQKLPKFEGISTKRGRVQANL